MLLERVVQNMKCRLLNLKAALQFITYVYINVQHKNKRYLIFESFYSVKFSFMKTHQSIQVLPAQIQLIIFKFYYTQVKLQPGRHHSFSNV